MPVPYLPWMQPIPPGPAPGPLPPTDAVMPRKPTILDRLLNRIFPTAQYTGLLDPNQQQALQQQGVRQFASNLLVAGGASPQQRGTLANIGASLGGVDVNALADHAIALQAYRQQQEDNAAIAKVAASHPLRSDQSPFDRITQIMEDLPALGPAGVRAAAALAQVADAIKPAAPHQPQEISGVVDTRLGSPTIGQTGTFLIPYPGAPKEEWTFVKGKPEQASQLTPFQRQNLQQKAEFGAAALAALKPLDQIRRDNPNVETEVGKILSSPAFAQAVPGFRSSADAVAAIAKAGGSPAAQKYIRASWSFLDNVLRTRYATGRLGGPMLAQMAQEFLPSLDPEGNAQVHMNQLQAILSAQGESGFDLDPQIWRNATKRHGVSDIDLENILSGGSGNTRLEDIRSRYGKP